MSDTSTYKLKGLHFGIASDQATTSLVNYDKLDIDIISLKEGLALSSPRFELERSMHDLDHVLRSQIISVYIR